MLKTSLFWTYADNLPPDAGYELFGPEHFGILAGCLFVIVCGYVCFDRIVDGDCSTADVHSIDSECSDANDHRIVAGDHSTGGIDCAASAAGMRYPATGRTVMLRIIAAALPALIIAREICVCVAGARMVYELPLHLCSLAGIICFIYEYTETRLPRSVRATLGQALYALCLPGAVLALLFSDGTMYPVFHFITIESNLFHALIILYVILKLKTGDIRPAVRDAYRSIIFLCCIVPPVYIFDRCFRANYMFLLNPSAGSPLASFYVNHGYPVYLICYALAAVIEIILINLAGEFIANKLLCKRTANS